MADIFPLTSSSTAAAPPTEAAIEEVARRICRFYGIDPDAKEYHQKGDWGRVMSYYGTQWLRFREQAVAGLIAASFLQFG